MATRAYILTISKSLWSLFSVLRAKFGLTAAHVLPGSYDNKRASSEQLSVSARRSNFAVFGHLPALISPVGEHRICFPTRAPRSHQHTARRIWSDAGQGERELLHCSFKVSKALSETRPKVAAPYRVAPSSSLGKRSLASPQSALSIVFPSHLQGCRPWKSSSTVDALLTSGNRPSISPYGIDPFWRCHDNDSLGEKKNRAHFPYQVSIRLQGPRLKNPRSLYHHLVGDKG
ncbi:hypothetical protein KC319_g59 [Hortaea werneckii]|nr:hypothetical protein KC319_g59 [Hortaea werneckii]